MRSALPCCVLGLELAFVAGCTGEHGAAPLPPESVEHREASETTRPEAELASSPGSTEARPDVAPTPQGMVAIPPGIFLMGSREDHGAPEEHPMHEVVIAGFHLDRTEVTVLAYRACVEAGACPRPRADRPFCNERETGRDDHPVNCVPFAAAEAYCAFTGKRLPTEQEWEYAAKGGDEQRRYAWGDEPPDGRRACFAHVGTCPVGAFAPGAFGLHDMSGNVWEWTSSRFGPYPEESAAGADRVYRGGSWSRRFPKWLRTQVRNRYPEGEYSAALGLRCALTPKPLECPEDAAISGDRCVRARGTPRCEPGRIFRWGACRLDVPELRDAPDPRGLTPDAPTPVIATPSRTSDPPAPPPPRDAEPVRRARSSSHDGDCQTHQPARPVSHRFEGGTFEARRQALSESGCAARDVGMGWTSACCGE